MEMKGCRGLKICMPTQPKSSFTDYLKHMRTHTSGLFLGSNLKDFLLLFVIHALLLSFFVWEIHRLFPSDVIGVIGIKMNDYSYFLGSIDNYFIYGTITDSDPTKAFAGRMPGYGMPYLLLRLVFKQSVAITLLMFAQVIFSVLANLWLGKLYLLLFDEKRGARVCSLIFATFAPLLVFNLFTLSESFSVSAFIGYFYFLIWYIRAPRPHLLLLSGFFLGWLVFLRPFMGLLLPLTALFLWMNAPAKQWVRNCILVFLAFGCFELAWITRNYLALNRFIPLETPLNESYSERSSYRKSALAIRGMINAFGGESGEFYPGAEGAWFHSNDKRPVPDDLFTPRFLQLVPADSLLHLKAIFLGSGSPDNSESVCDSLNELAYRTAGRYAAVYRRAHPLHSYLLVPVAKVFEFVFTNGTILMMMPPFNEMNILEKSIKLIYFLHYYFILLSGILFGFFIAYRSMTMRRLLFIPILLPWFIAALLILYTDLYIIQQRYLLSMLPGLMIFSSYGIMWILDRLVINKRDKS